MSQDFEQITVVSVTGLADARGAALSLALSQAHLPGSKALLCSPTAPADLPKGIVHRPIAPMNYQEYSWFMMFALWRVVETEFALVVQDDGWVVNAGNWQDSFLDHDYIGAPIHLAQVTSGAGQSWSQGFAWSPIYGLPGHRVTPVQNGGFSLRSRQFMRALIDHPHIRAEIPPPEFLGGTSGHPLQMSWPHGLLQEDVQLTGVLRPALEAAGLKFAPIEVARAFSIEYAGPALHHGWNAMALFGHHARSRRIKSLHPLTLACTLSEREVDNTYGERDILTMFERNGYQIEFAPESRASAPTIPAAARKVYDCFTYNGEDDVLAIRLHELDEVVDCFVIVEAACTFDGAPKKLRFNPDDPRFAAFRSRMRYVALHDMPSGDEEHHRALVGDWLSDTPATWHWVREKFQRNQIMRGLWDACAHDLVMVSDIDEIPRAHVVAHMRDDAASDQFALTLGFFYFYANYRCLAGPEAQAVWTVASTFARLQQTTPDKLRMGLREQQPGVRLIANAGWHLSYLGMTDDDVRHKIATFAHQEYNTPEQMAAVDIRALTSSGRDLFNRPGYAWEIVPADDAPRWLAHQSSLSHLFLPAQQDNASRYDKECYVTAHPETHGFWETHANRGILKSFAPKICGHVVDVGCNHGASTYWLTENPLVTRITGVDLNEKALDVASGIFASAPLPAKFVRLDATQQGLALNEADTVVSFHTLEHIYPQDVGTFLQNIFNALKPEGHLVISIPYDRAYPDPCHVGFYTEERLNSVMQQAGFEALECFKDDRFVQKDLLTGLYRKPATVATFST